MSIAEKLTTVAENQQKVYDAGYAKGKAEGGDNHYDTFWDAYQYNGERKDYQYAFSQAGWRNENFKPKYPLTGITNASSMFARCRMTEITTPIDLTDCTNTSFMFNNALNLNVISEITFSEKITNATSMFASCGALQHITVKGVISTSLGMSKSPLTKDSILSVVNALDDTTTGLTLTLKETAVKAAFETSEGAADGNTSTEWTALVATKPNWTIALA